MEATSELAWFRGEIWRSLVRPRDFARGLAREHYGLAGVFVAVVAGAGLSIGVDLLVLASKGISPAAFVPRLLIDAGLLGVRLAVTAAFVAWIATGAIRALGRRGGTLDQLFTALTFAAVPLILIPLTGLVVSVATTTETLAIAAFVVLAIVLRVLIGLALNIRGILPPAIAVAAFVVVILLGSFVLGDQVSRMRFLGYAIVPQLVDDFPVAPAQGQKYEMLGFDLIVPAGWKIASSGVSGEAARFESSSATLTVTRARGAALSTADSYADSVGGPQRVGLHDSWQQRDVTRINGIVVVDDRYAGNYEGRHVLWRQFTAAPGGQGLALVYRVVEPADEQAALAEAASIAATWHINTEGR
ncbi:MAG: Yip1 family protein [Candidatus Limnocylindria bacterium]|nr:Yip1 family protein [Candidatus Limnocylindria bacterium]